MMKAIVTEQIIEYRLHPGEVRYSAALPAHCGQRLATYKVPAEFRFTGALPVDASGKILKRELRTRE